MRLGFTNIYAWRPHVEHMQFLALTAQRGGHEVRYLACDSDFPTCYSRQLRPGSPAPWECFKCRSGSSRSYAASGVSSIGRLAPDAGQAALQQARAWTRSSSNTLWRFESPDEFASPQAESTAAALAPGAARAHAAALHWIERERLEGLFIFNGRMDATRGVLEAARVAGIPFVTIERSWFGDGLWLMPGENCLGLRNVDRLVGEYANVPLTASQAALIARQVASRFMHMNAGEWRAYNRDAVHATWPHRHDRPRVLFLPSSRNEFHGHPDWDTGWREPTQALDALIDHLGLQPEDCVLRCHPNWGEVIGHATGAMPERYYTEWGKRRGIMVIPSRDKSSTLSLIEEADAIVVNGSSAGLDAGVLGRQVIATGPCTYQRGGFADLVHGEQELRGLQLLGRGNPQASAHIARQSLRYGHTMVGRVPQFVRHVRGDSSYEYRYYHGADPGRLVRMLDSGELLADDPERAQSAHDEDAVVQAILQRRWHDLFRTATDPSSGLAPMRIERRPLYRAVDVLRRLRPIGDR